MDERETTRAAFLSETGWGGAQVFPLAGDASTRRYFRLTRRSGQRCLLMDAPGDQKALGMFVSIAAYLSDLGLSPPDIFSADEVQGFLLVEDLGDALYSRNFRGSSATEWQGYQAAVDVLRHLHGAPPLDDLPKWNAVTLAALTQPAVTWYSGQTASDALKFSAGLEPLFAPIAAAPQRIALRDYHAENLIWLPDRAGIARVGLLDFQDAVLCHPAYDLISLTRDARRDLDDDLTRALADRFLDKSNLPRSDFEYACAVLAVQRNIRILGVFARLALRHAKLQYISMIPRVWGHIMTDLRHPDLEALSTLVRDALPSPDEVFLGKLRKRCLRNPGP